MKILELRFKNLNSLYGEWHIDFTNMEYVANGIFALTGPTGAGKSTVLDAICLALYGATPRLGKITKSGNEIMSRQTGECFAEVTFQSQKGRFRCHWGQHRARKKTDGNLADARHEISDVQTGKPIETKKSLVLKVIEEKTGMDFQRFTRSILLAQGGFDTFLKANVEEKSKILEQITGTEIYTEISRRVHEKQRDEHTKQNLLEAEISGITLLEPEQEKDLQKELEDKQKKEKEIAIKVAETGKAMSWLQVIGGLKKEIGSLAAEAEKLNSKLARFQPQRERLVKALLAADFDGNFAELASLRKQQGADKKALQTEKSGLPDLLLLVERSEEALKRSEKLAEKAKQESQTAAPLIQRVRLLDQRLEEMKKAVDSGVKDCIKEEGRIGGEKKLKTQAQRKRNRAEGEFNTILKYLKSNHQDEWLVSGFAGIKEQMGNLQSALKGIESKQQEEREAEKKLQSATKSLTSCSMQLADKNKEVARNKKLLEFKKKNLDKLLGNRLLREYRTEKEALLREMVFMRKINDLEFERAKLEDGRPCPLCGAEEHPFAQGNIPVMDATEKRIELLNELIQRAEVLESEVSDLGTLETQALKKMMEVEKLESRVEHEKSATEKGLEDVKKNLEEKIHRLSVLKKETLMKLQPLGVEILPAFEVSSVLDSLNKRRIKWQDQEKKKIQIEKWISDLDSDLKRFEAVIETKNTILAEKQSILANNRKELDGAITERFTLFGDKKTNEEEARLRKAVSAAEHVEKQAGVKCNEAKKKYDAAKVTISSLEERIAKTVAVLKHMEMEFKTKLDSAGFAEEQQFLLARIPVEERDNLTNRVKELDNLQTDLLARQKDRKNRLTAEIEKSITEARMEELAPISHDLETNLKILRDEIAAIKHRMVENNSAKERVVKKQSKIIAQKKECDRWDKLHVLIGAADGKKYRNFAQGLTFELMVSHANRQLSKMTDRYLLIRDEEQPLELNVIDNYQAGEIRSSKNLSGGESFIVSLTLALGLSKMASRKVRVDSLFLDEGFGTLDEDALETALEVLSGLQQRDKLIGVISHVPALKERINSQISITPLSGGKSIITGPGCCKVVTDKQ